jgi:signal transduction histidine kinase
MATASVSGVDWSRRGEMRLVVGVAVGVAGAVGAAVMAWATARSPILVDPKGIAAWQGVFVASYVGVGVYTWWRRPESRLGPLVAGAGFLYSVTCLTASGAPLAYTLGTVVFAAVIVYFPYVYLCFPRGRLESRLERVFMLAFALSTALVWGLILALAPTLPPGGDFTNCGTRCPHNALQIVSGHAATGAALNTAYSVVTTISLIGIVMLISTKARSSTHLRRRALAPLAVVFIANIAEFVIALFVTPDYPGTREMFRIANGVVSLALPIAILVGQVRGDAFAAMSLGQIAVRGNGKPLTPVAVQDVIGDALGDSTIALALWAPERAGYVDVYGAPVELPRDPRVRGVTRVTRGNGPVAALIHDPTLDTDSDVVEGLAATSLMLLENTRLVEELRASRSRIVEAAESERRRLERDLHDGAQQRLVAIQVRVDLARELTDPEDAAKQLDAIAEDAVAGLEELRALAHGIYPGVLHELGPAAALSSLARSSSVPIKVTDEGIARSSDAVEAAIYFCAREAIQNTAKHAGPGANVTVALAGRKSMIQFTVTDNGAGMPPETDTNGTGITGMRDRIEAVGGQFEIVSAPGQGTSVRGTIPDGEW